MWFIFLFIGFIIGVTCSLIFKPKDNTKIYGQIDVEESSGLCRIRIADDGLMDPKVKQAIFEVKHDALISRDEQGL